MKKNFAINKEYSNNKKSISVKFNDFYEIKESQLKMIVNNDINYLLSTKFMQTEEKVCLYYAYGNMITFAEMFFNKKMAVSDAVVFLKSFLYMIDELEGYLLSSKGILLDYNYIFYDNSAEDYRYIHIPVENEDFSDKEILDFFEETIKKYYENISDDFATEILDIISNNKGVDNIRKIISKYDSKSILGKIKNNIKENIYDDDFQTDVDIYENQSNIPSFYKKSNDFYSPIPQKPKINKKEKSNSKFKNKPQINKEIKKEKTLTEKTQKEKNSSIKITAFIAIQVLAGAIIAKIAMAHIEIEQLIALIIATVVIDAIIAKELFFKNKNNNNKDKKVKEKIPKQVKEKIPKQQKIQVVPQKSNVPQKAPNTNFNKEIPPKNILELKNEEPIIQSKPQNEQAVPNKLKPEQAIQNIQGKEISNEIKKQDITYEPQNDENVLIIEKDNDDKFERTVLMPVEQNEDIDIEMEKTVLMNQNVPIGYIEVYDKENTITDKFVITKEKIIIGRLKSQVDLQIKDLMIGKIHAEIVLKDNTIFVRDICSLNGVYIGESRKKIKQDVQIPINSGEILYLADTKIKVYSV